MLITLFDVTTLKPVVCGCGSNMFWRQLADHFKCACCAAEFTRHL